MTKSGVVSGLVASLCCVGPAIAIAFGLGGGALLGLVRYRLAFLAVGGLMMVLSVGLAMQQARACCTPAQRRRHLGQLLATSLASFALTYMIGAWFIPSAAVIWAAARTPANSPATVVAPAEADAVAPVTAVQRRVTLEIKGMYCAVCVGLVRYALRAMPGVTQADSSLRGAGWAIYDPAQTTADQLANAVSLYFPATVRADEPYSP